MRLLQIHCSYFQKVTEYTIIELQEVIRSYNDTIRHYSMSQTKHYVDTRSPMSKRGKALHQSNHNFTVTDLRHVTDSYKISVVQQHISEFNML